MGERDELLLGFVREMARHSALRGDEVPSPLKSALACLAAGTGTPSITAERGPLQGEDLLVAHELDLWSALDEVGLPDTGLAADPADPSSVEGSDAAPGVDSSDRAWLPVRGRSGRLLALRLDPPPGGWDPEGLTLAFAGSVADELSVALLRHWTERQHLDRSEALLEAQRHTHVGCFEWDIVADKVRWSDELFRIFGNEPQSFEPTFEEFLERIHEDDRDAVRASVYEAYDARRDYRIEERIVRPDGSVRQLASWGHVIVDEQTVPVKIVGSCQDVTDFRSAMRELSKTERRLAEIQERRARAMELNDNVVQGLAAALYALELGRSDAAATEITGTLQAARSIIGDLLTASGEDVDSAELVRNDPAPSFLAPEAPTAGASVAERTEGTTRLVIADDSSDIRWLTSMILAVEDDFDVVGEAQNGAEAVELVLAHRPEMVLLDLAMPVLDGLSAIPQIRAASPHTVIVVFSGFNAGSAAQEALERGAHAYVEKGQIDVALPDVLRGIRAQAATDPPRTAGTDI